MISNNTSLKIRTTDSQHNNIHNNLIQSFFNLKSDSVSKRPIMASKAQAPGGSGRPRSGVHKRPGQELERPSTASSSSMISFAEPVPLKFVVQEAVKRWFEDTKLEAQKGDIKQQALLGQMYAEGYGCVKDAKTAKEWIDKAHKGGYNMRGVYCEL